MYPRDGMHLWPVPSYEITGKNPWLRAFQRWAPLYVLLAVSMYIAHFGRSDGPPSPLNVTYQIPGLLFLLIHGLLLALIVALSHSTTIRSPESVVDSGPEAISAKLRELGELPAPRWRSRLLAAVERCTHNAIRRSLEFELATRDQLSRVQNDALELSTQLVVRSVDTRQNRVMLATWLVPAIWGLCSGILLQFSWEPLPYWRIGLIASVMLLWCLDVPIIRALFRKTERRFSNDLCVARALDEPQLLVEALRHMENADWERNDGPENFSARYWRERREKLEAALQDKGVSPSVVGE